MATRGISDFVRAGQILADMVEPRPTGERMAMVVHDLNKGGIRYAEAVREFKKRFLIAVLIQCNGNSCRAASVVRMHRNTFSRTCAELKIDAGSYRQRKVNRGA